MGKPNLPGRQWNRGTLGRRGTASLLKLSRTSRLDDSRRRDRRPDVSPDRTSTPTPGQSPLRPELSRVARPSFRHRRPPPRSKQHLDLRKPEYSFLRLNELIYKRRNFI